MTSPLRSDVSCDTPWAVGRCASVRNLRMKIWSLSSGIHQIFGRQQTSFFNEHRSQLPCGLRLTSGPDPAEIGEASQIQKERQLLPLGFRQLADRTIARQQGVVDGAIVGPISMPEKRRGQFEHVPPKPSVIKVDQHEAAARA